MKKELKRLIAKVKMGWLSSLMLLVATSSCGDLTLVKEIKSFADEVKKEFNIGDSTLANYLKNNCSDCDTCIINLKQVYNIDFDKYYLILELHNEEMIADIIKLPYYDYTTDDNYRLIFIKEKDIVDDYDIRLRNQTSVSFSKLAKNVALYNPEIKAIKKSYNGDSFWELISLE